MRKNFTLIELLVGATGLTHIDSAVFNLAVLSGWQSTALDSAFYYGGSFESVLGFLEGDFSLNKNYYSMTMFGELLARCTKRCQAFSKKKSVSMLAATSDDAQTACLLVSDYRGQGSSIDICLDGLEQFSCISCKLLDEDHNSVPMMPFICGNRLTLAKKGGSASFLLTFERKK